MSKSDSLINIASMFIACRTRGNRAVAKVFQLIGVPTPGAGGGRGGGGFGFGGGQSATTGDYLVVMQVGGSVVKQTLRVDDRNGR